MVVETKVRSSPNVCKSLIGIDGSHFFPYPFCQLMPTGLYIRWEIDVDLQWFERRSKKERSFKRIVVAYLQNSRWKCKLESFHTTGNHKKIDRFSVGGFCGHCAAIVEALGCFYHFCECQEIQPGLTKEDNVTGQRRGKRIIYVGRTC